MKETIEIIEKLNQVLIAQERHAVTLDYIKDETERQEKNLADQKQTLDRLTVTVEKHEARSTTLENTFKKFFKEQFLPVKEYVDLIKSTGKILGGIVVWASKIGAAAGVFYGLMKIVVKIVGG